MTLRNLARVLALSIAASMLTISSASAYSSSKCFVHTQTGREVCLLYYQGELSAIWTQGIGIKFLH